MTDPREATDSLRPRPHPNSARRRLWGLSERITASLAIGSLGALFVALLDTSWVRNATPFALAPTWLATAGVLVPLGLGLGLGLGLASWLLHPEVPPTIAGAVERLRRSASGRPADIAAFAPLCALGVFSWATLCAYLARYLLALDVTPALCSLVLAVASTALGGLVAVIVLALTPHLRRRLALSSDRWRTAVDPAATLGVSIALISLLFWIGMRTGTVSGDGGLLGIYGVFKRQELDLRAPALLGLLSLAICTLPAFLRAVSPARALALAVSPLCLTWLGAGQLDETPDLARAIERHAAVSRGPLALMQKWSDQDGDGIGSTFGGGDCNDRNPKISPAAEDLPDNGVDEDCSGSDLSLAALGSSQPKALPAPSPLDKIPSAGNLLFVTIDTLRYDLGYAGYKRPISPEIDKLAARSTVIERAYALASYTGKSVGPMLIGKYGSETHRNWGHFNTFSEADTFVAQRMQRAGIHTVSVQAHRYFGKFGGLERGFDELDLSAAPPKGAKWAHDARITSGLLTDAAIAQLKAVPKGKRFFAWVHYLDPHADYKRHEGAPNFGSKARDLYDGEVWFTDRQIGRLLDFVKQAGLSDNTSIILTSDHGEAFGEHKMWRHGFELWETLVRVPLLVHIPGAPARRVSARRSLIDIVPTMLDLMRLPAVPHSSQAKDDNFVSGLSLVADVLNEPPTSPTRDILVDMPGGPYNGSRRAFIHNDLKLIISRGAHKELYDLKADPAERKNIWRTKRQRIEAPYAAFKKGLKEIEVKGKRK